MYKNIVFIFQIVIFEALFRLNDDDVAIQTQILETYLESVNFSLFYSIFTIRCMYIISENQFEVGWIQT